MSMSVDDLAEIPPWKKKPVAGGRSVAKQKNAPPCMVGESSSVVSLDDRREKREKDRADFKKFLSEKRHVKALYSCLSFSLTPQLTHLFSSNLRWVAM